MVLLEIDPNVVKPGWTPLIITILLAAAIALLMISMRRHMRRVNLPYRDEVDGATSAQAQPDAAADGTDASASQESDPDGSEDTSTSAKPADGAPAKTADSGETAESTAAAKADQSA